MTCETARQLLPLLLYGELAFEEEDRLEQHLESCAECRAARAQEEQFHAMLDRAEPELPPGLLARNRRSLSAAVTREMEHHSHPAWWVRLGSFLSNPPAALKPVGALAMLALGFGLARWDTAPPVLARLTDRDVDPSAIARVRMVSNDPSGRVRLAYDEVRPREVVGALNDESIRRVLLAAASDPADPAMRVESLDLLKGHADDEAVRQALLNALQTDKNSGVRLKALEGLKAYATHGDTRKVLRLVLLSDDNPGVRAMAIDMLVENRGPETAGVLQELLHREQENYVRTRCQRALSEMKASVGTF
jgi:HEAT repeat protein